MLRRVFAFLLLVCLAAPSLAMTGHCAPASAPRAMHSAHGMGHQPQHEAPTQHDCIGCVAPLHGGMALADAWQWHEPRMDLSLTVPFVGTVSPPETPPPQA